METVEKISINSCFRSFEIPRTTHHHKGGLLGNFIRFGMRSWGGKRVWTIGSHDLDWWKLQMRFYARQITPIVFNLISKTDLSMLKVLYFSRGKKRNSIYHPVGLRINVPESIAVFCEVSRLHSSYCSDFAFMILIVYYAYSLSH